MYIHSFISDVLEKRIEDVYDFAIKAFEKFQENLNA